MYQTGTLSLLLTFRKASAWYQRREQMRIALFLLQLHQLLLIAVAAEKKSDLTPLLIQQFKVLERLRYSMRNHITIVRSKGKKVPY